MLTPAMVASSLLVFMISMASYTAPLMFNVERIMTMQIVLSRTNGNLDMAATQSTILSLVSIAFLILMTWYQNRRNYQSQSKGIGVHRTEVRSSFVKYLFLIFSIIGVIILLLPILVIGLISFSVDGEWTTQIIPTSYTFEHYIALFTDSKTWGPIWNSIKMSTVAVIGNIIFGVAAAYAMVRYNFRGVIILLLPILVIGLISFSVDGEWTTQIIPTSYTFEHYIALFTDSKTWGPIWNSIKMSTVAVIGNIIFGVAAAYAMVRFNFRGKIFMDILIMVPWALPGTVVAVNLISAFSEGNIFSFNQVLVGTFWILPLAYFVRQLPLVFRNSQASLIQMDESVEEAALSLGANWWYSFRRVVLPVIMPGVLAGTLLAFIQGLTEFVASILIYTPGNIPLSVGIWNKVYSFEFGTASAYGMLQTVLIIAVLLINERIKGDSGAEVTM